MFKVSVIIITLNEQKNLPDCLESVKWADEIVIVDSESKDQTAEIARNFGCRVIVNSWPGHQEQKNVALNMASHEWILSVDADERITPEIQSEVQKIISNPSSLDGYTFPRKNMFLGRWMRHGGWYPDRVLRLFRKKKGQFGGINPHDHVLISSGSVGDLPFPIIHFSYISIEQYINKQSAYSRIGAKELFNSRGKRKISSLSMIVKFITKFLETYFWKRGLLDGFHGLIVSVGGAYFAMIREARVWELQQCSSALYKSPEK